MSDKTDDLAPSTPFEGITYSSYLKVPELLGLQHLLVGERSHDEHLFIIIHQAYELWFKQIIIELDTSAKLIANQQWGEAAHLLRRVVAIEKLLVDQIHILETMRPRDFCHFRAALKPASGFQSVQFREVEFFSGLPDKRYLRFLAEGTEERARLERRLAEPTLPEIFFESLRQVGYDLPASSPPETPEWDQAIQALLPIYRDVEVNSDLYDLCELIVSHDQWIGIWRYHHVRVVERIIGSKYGTGGSHGVKYLESTLTKRAVPLLWAVRTYLDESSLFATYEAPQ
ncbi:MAG: tryptophan 2,3-dioxygenase [Bradymonadia bacterium]|jgi:tryptophan 2,3-dioxygenase